MREPHLASENLRRDRRGPHQHLDPFASDAQFDALLAPATRDAIYVVLFVHWVSAIIMLGMIGQNLDATIHTDDGA